MLLLELKLPPPVVALVLAGAMVGLSRLHALIDIGQGTVTWVALREAAS